jgi:hypothetical protein
MKCARQIKSQKITFCSYLGHGRYSSQTIYVVVPNAFIIFVPLGNSELLYLFTISTFLSNSDPCVYISMELAFAHFVYMIFSFIPTYSNHFNCIIAHKFLRYFRRPIFHFYDHYHFRNHQH